MKSYKIALAYLMSLLILLSLSGCAQEGISQEEYDNVVAERDELKEKNETLSQSLDEALEIAKKHTEEEANSIETRDIMFAAAAKTMNENAVCTIVTDELILITVPSEGKAATDVKAQIDSSVITIPLMLKNSDFKSCVIMVVDDTQTCLFGYTIKADGASTFISDALSDL